MEAHEYKTGITVKFTVDLLKRIDDLWGKGKNFKDRSDAIRSLMQLGLQVQDLMKLQKDPAKAKELEKKFKILLKQDSYEKELDAWDEGELSALILYATKLKDKKFQQSILSLNKY